VSNQVYQELKTKGSTVMSASGEGPKVFNLVKSAELDMSTVKLSNGRVKLIKTLHARSADGKEHIYINDDAANPIITNMSIGWSITLHDID
jgi:hypothetical protein